MRYKIKGKYGKWQLVQFEDSNVIYSICENCGYMHKTCECNLSVYLPQEEDERCPNCLEDMQLDKHIVCVNEKFVVLTGPQYRRERYKTAVVLRPEVWLEYKEGVTDLIDGRI